MIPFNKPYFTGKETKYIAESVASGKISGDGKFTALCHEFFESRFGFLKCLLTTSCTDALEMAAILIGIEPGDEVIVPSYTFVSTANAFVLRGAKIVFADSRDDRPGIDEKSIRALVTPKTKAIVPVHYAGIACDMEEVMKVADEFNLYVIEDAAQAIDSYYTFANGETKPLGSIGDFGTFSFHETKNIMSGEGGMLAINNEKFIDRAEIIREKGTNRSKFFRGEVNKYGWVDIGSSFLPSDIISAFLYAQLENLDAIQKRRCEIWDFYYTNLKSVSAIDLPIIPSNSTNNAHMFYILLDSVESRGKLIECLKSNGVWAVFHYQSLHKSRFFENQYEGDELVNSEKYTDCLLRLPLYFELTPEDLTKIVETIKKFFR